MEEDLKSASSEIKDNDSPAYQPAPVKPERQLPKKPLIIAAVLIVLAILGFFIFKALNKTENIDNSTDVNQVAETVETKEVPEDISLSALTESYNSTPLNISFKYPKDWKVSEADGGISVVSPTFNYRPAQMATQDGNFKIYIRQGARKQDSPYIGSGIAIKPSEKLTYTQPAVDQRKDTWLSSFGYDSPDIFSFFLIAGNFELKQGDQLGPDYGKEPDTYLVIGGYSGTTAVDDIAMNSVDLDYYATTNAYKQALKIIATIQLN